MDGAGPEKAKALDFKEQGQYGSILFAGLFSSQETTRKDTHR